MMTKSSGNEWTSWNCVRLLSIAIMIYKRHATKHNIDKGDLIKMRLKHDRRAIFQIQLRQTIFIVLVCYYVEVQGAYCTYTFLYGWTSMTIIFNVFLILLLGNTYKYDNTELWMDWHKKEIYLCESVSSFYV